MAHPPPPSPYATPLDYQNPHGIPGSARTPQLTRFGGGLGVAGCCVGLLIFLAACAGLGAAVRFSLIPIALGAASIILSLAGGVIEHKKLPEDTAVFGALFAGALSLIGGLVEMSVWMGWR
jgi:hypothetical protein